MAGLCSRLMAITIWGTKANGGKYAAISALTNIPATLFATLVYEVIFTDSSRGMSPNYQISFHYTTFFLVLPTAQQDFLNGHKAHLNHKNLDFSQRISSASHGSTEKASFQVMDGV